MRRVLSALMIASVFLLFSVSPVLAEEISESTSDDSGSVEQSADSNESNTGAQSDDSITGGNSKTDEGADGDSGSSDGVADTNVENPVIESVVEIPKDENPVVDAVVEIADGVEEPFELTAGDGAVTDGPINVVEEKTAEDVEEYLDNAVLNVVVPIAVSITIDPLELAGKGQVYSKTYNIVNDGETDVMLTFTDIKVNFGSDASYAVMTEPFEETLISDMKSIFMQLDFNRSDIPSAVITDFNKTTDVAISLSPPKADGSDDSLLQFNFSGCVNDAPTIPWKDDDIMISMNYTLQIVPPTEDVVVLPEESVVPSEETSSTEVQALPVPSTETGPDLTETEEPVSGAVEANPSNGTNTTDSEIKNSDTVDAVISAPDDDSENGHSESPQGPKSTEVSSSEETSSDGTDQDNQGSSDEPSTN